jgi:rhamnose transport system ATP-binding protein
LPEFPSSASGILFGRAELLIKLAAMRSLLEARTVTKAFAGVQALKGVSFELSEGEVHALIGENGAGKSTLIKIMTGAVKADSGTLLVSGRVVPHIDPSLAQALGIAAIYQQPSLFPQLSVAENIAIALEAGNAFRTVNWKDRNRRALELIEQVGGRIKPQRLVSTLSMPEQQLVEIAKAIGAKAKVLIMDEPTASLTEREVERLFTVIRALRGQGVGIVYISHRLEEISSVADRITVLRDGEAVGTVQASEADRHLLINMMVGREVTAVFSRGERSQVFHGNPLLDVHNLKCSAAGIREISLSLRTGEILGVAGLVGSGRTQVAEALFGLSPADGGEIRMRGKAVRITSPADAIRLGIGYVPEDRRRHGVILDMPITANTSLANLSAVSRHGLIQGSAERELAQSYIDRLLIRASSVYSDTGKLSGGNQQKVALARWLAIKPAVLILDEPTQGVDVASKAEIHRLMSELAERGLAIIMISSELPEILAMSDRIVVMRAGKVAGNLSRKEATQQKILSLALEDSIA